MKFKAPSALSQQHLPVLVFLSLFTASPSLSCIHRVFGPIKTRNEHLQFQLQQSSLKGDTAGRAAGTIPVLVGSRKCSAPSSFSPGNTGNVCLEILWIKALHKEDQLQIPVMPVTHWSIQHPLGCCCQSPVSFQAVSKVTGLSQPTFPCCLCCRPLDTLPPCACVQFQTFPCMDSLTGKEK